jgi:hypothetical protein
MILCSRALLLGSDQGQGRLDSLTLEASSLFDAAEQAIGQWARLWPE